MVAAKDQLLAQLRNSEDRDKIAIAESILCISAYAAGRKKVLSFGSPSSECLADDAEVQASFVELDYHLNGGMVASASIRFDKMILSVLLRLFEQFLVGPILEDLLKNLLGQDET